MDSYYAGDCPGDSNARDEEQLGQNPEDGEIHDAQHPAHIHGALKESLLALEAMPAHGTRSVHGEPSRKHLALHADRAPLGDDCAQAG